MTTHHASASHATPSRTGGRKKGKPRARVQPYVESTLAVRLRAYSAATSTTESAVVEAALLQYLDRTSDTMLLLRRLDHVSRANARTQRDLELLTETLAVFVKLWFAHTPPVPEDGKKIARASAEARFRAFVAHVTEAFSAGHRFADELPREPLADPEELRKAASIADV